MVIKAGDNFLPKLFLSMNTNEKSKTKYLRIEEEELNPRVRSTTDWIETRQSIWHRHIEKHRRPKELLITLHRIKGNEEDHKPPG